MTAQLTDVSEKSDGLEKQEGSRFLSFQVINSIVFYSRFLQVIIAFISHFSQTSFQGTDRFLETN